MRVNDRYSIGRHKKQLGFLDRVSFFKLPRPTNGNGFENLANAWFQPYEKGCFRIRIFAATLRYPEPLALTLTPASTLRPTSTHQKSVENIRARK